MASQIWRNASTRRRFLGGSTAAGLGAVGLLATGCGDDDEQVEPPTGATGPAGATPTETPRQGGTLNFRGFSDLARLDMRSTSQTNAVVWPLASVYRGLLKYDPAKPDITPDAIQADLAEKWEVADPTTLVFKLRDGVLFHSGAKMTSADVKANLDWIKEPPAGKVSAFKAPFGQLERVEAPDPLTVRLVFKRPNPSFLGNFAALPYGINEGSSLLRDGEVTTPDGTGPMKLKKWDKGIAFELERNSTYRNGVPPLDGVKWTVIPDQDAAKASFIAGQIHIYATNGRGPQDLDEVKSSLGNKVVTVNTPSVTRWYMQFNAEKYRDVRIRKAIHLAVNRNDLNTIEWLGLSKVGAYMKPGGAWALPSNEVVQLPGFGSQPNLTEVKALLSAAGASDLKVAIQSSQIWKTAMEVVQQALGKAGINASITIQDTPAWRTSWASGNYDMIIGAMGPVTDDPDATFGDLILKGGQSNSGAVSSDDTDRLFAKQSIIFDTEERKTVVRELEKASAELYSTSAISWQLVPVAYYSTVKNFSGSYSSSYAGAAYQLENTWLSG